MRYARSWGNFGALIAVGALLLAAAGCGSDNSAPAETQAPAGGSVAESAPEATVPDYGTDKIRVVVSPGPSEDALKAVAPGFTAETGVKVEFVEIAYGDLLTKLLLGASSGESGYDVVQYDGPMIRALAEVGALAELDNQVQLPEYDISDFSEKLQDYARSDDGHTYGLPLSTEPYLLWYRTDLFKTLGLEVPTTWDEYTANAKALSDAGYGGSLMVYGPKESTPWFLQSIRSHGTDPWNNDFEPQVASDAGIAGLTMMMNLLPYTPDGALNAGADDLTSIFIQQDVGQMIQASGYYSIANDPKQSKVVGKFAMAEPPNAPGYKETMLYGWLIGLMKSSPNQTAGWAFLEYSLGKDGVRDLVNQGAPPPGRKSLIEDPTILAELPYLPTLIAATDYARTSARLVEGAEVGAAISSDVNEIATGGMSPADGAAKIDKDLTAVFKTSGRL